MYVTDPAALQQLAGFKQAYADLPWYKRAWFFIWSIRLWYALFSIDLTKPTQEQVNRLLSVCENVWFFKSIFGLLDTTLKEAIKEKPFQFQKLPAALCLKVGNMGLTLGDLSSLTQVSRREEKLFQPVLNVNTFLKHVTGGNYKKVEEMLRSDPSLLTREGDVTDCSNRNFCGISGIKCAFWYLDKHMWARMLACIPNNRQGEQIRAEVLKQYQEIIDAGVTYTLNGIKTTEHHFDFQNTIIKELQVQVDSANEPNPNWDVIDNQWRVGVGGAQKLLPMHVVHEYCSEEPFYPKPPSFMSQPTLKTQFYNCITGEWEHWFHVDSKLGINCAIYKGIAMAGGRGGWRAVVGGRRAARVRGAVGVSDLAAITALYEVRAADFKKLGGELGYHPVEQQYLVSQL